MRWSCLEDSLGRKSELWSAFSIHSSQSQRDDG